MEYSSLYDLVHYDRGGIWSYVTSPVDYTKFFSTVPERKQMVMTRVPEMVCPSSTAGPTCDSCGSGYNDPEDKISATGSYAGVEGTLNIKDGSNTRCKNTGLFVYKFTRKFKQITDGTSKTFAFGEVKGADTHDGFNLWTQAFRNGSTMRNTKNAINTPPGTPKNSATHIDCQYGPCWNGAFGSDHPGGAMFCFADGHVTFVTDNIATDIYEAAATYAGNESVAAPD
jgi:prepilin-type processing-associated H-X9-DG protein